MRNLGLTIALFAALSLSAQPDNLGSLELKVTDRYKAQVKDARKILEQPNYQDSINQKMDVQYKIFSTPLSVSINPEPLSPARIGPIEVPELYRAYIRGAYGLYNTGLGEVFYNSKRSSQQSYGFSARHLSSVGGVDNLFYDNNGFSRNHLGAYYNRYYRKYTWRLAADVDLNKYTYYGLPADILPTQRIGLDPENPQFNWYRSFGINTSLIEAREQELGWMKSLDLGYNFFYDNYKAQEHDAELRSDWILPAGDQNLNLELNAAFFNTAYDSIYSGADSTSLFNQSFIQMQMKPYIRVDKDEYALDFGVNLYFVGHEDNRNIENQGGAYFFPELILRYRAVPDVLSVVGGITGFLERNTYRDLSANNPFVNPAQSSVPSRSLKAFVAMEGLLSSNTSFKVEGGFKNLRSDAFFFRNPNLNDFGLSVLYQDLNELYASGSISYNWEEKFLLTASAIAREFDTDPGELALYRPYFEAQLESSYIYRQKVGLGLLLNYVGARHAFNQGDQITIPAMLSPYVDLGLKIDYYYNSRIGAFINLSNLLNSDYDIYLGYKAQGINALFGFTYRF